MANGCNRAWSNSGTLHTPPISAQPRNNSPRSLGNKYPNNDLQWADALTRAGPGGRAIPRAAAAEPVRAVTYPDSAARPALGLRGSATTLAGSANRVAGRLKEDRIARRANRLGVPRMETMRFEDGATEPVIVVEGQTTVCCVLRGVGPHPENNDFYTSIQFTTPSWTDSFVSFFCFCR